ncbi:MAG: ABC transporter ATP-binding protein [Chloroflexi bacterium]|nr:ABC transporter ATP-binding protein [Chloroflexota bacterium]
MIQARELNKSYPKGKQQAIALRAATFKIRRGEFVAIMGPSGSGKSTLLYTIGCLVRLTGGQYWLEGREITQLSERELAQVRSRYVGFVFQSFHLLPGLSALRNVELPGLYNQQARRTRRDRARQLLERVGLAERMDHRPAELSGGESQRVAIARALMNDPPLILADEPTGNLDSANGQLIMELLQELHREGRTVMMVTHDAEIARRNADRILNIRDGVLVEK